MKRTILLVEDSRIQRMATETILHRAGYLVLFAENGEEALHLARESVPDLILLDLLLPGIGGEEVLYALKRDPKTEPIPVIVLSQVPATDSAHLRAAGAVCYFEKARLADDMGGREALLARIDTVLRQSEVKPAAGKRLPSSARRQTLPNQVQRK